MELTWPIKIRIAAAAVIGILFFGIFAWPMAEPKDPFGLVLLPNLPSLALLLILAVAAGFAAYFICWPYGKEVGVLAVPIGLSIWAMRSGYISTFLQQNPSLSDRHAFFSAMRFESVGWLLIVAAGFAGVFLAGLISKAKKRVEIVNPSFSNSKVNRLLSIAIAAIAVVIVTNFLIGLLAQGGRAPDSRFGSVVAQPENAQIAFAVFMAFGLAAALAKYFLNINYMWITAASIFLPMYSTAAYLKPESLQYLAVNQPATFFSVSTIAVLPIQIVSIGAIGAVAGYWMVARYDHLRNN